MENLRIKRLALAKRGNKEAIKRLEVIKEYDRKKAVKYQKKTRKVGVKK